MTETKYKVVLYCPDTNLKLDGNIHNTRGLGGGKTALIKLAKAFSKLGCDMTFYAYTDGGSYDGVQYVRYEELENCKTDIFMAFTGHKLDLTELSGKSIDARLKILLVGGASRIKGLEELNFDCYYAISRYLKEILIREWGLPYEEVISVEHGYDPEDVPGFDRRIKRDPYGIIFASHPHKGLERVIEIVGALRDYEPRFYLDIYGSRKLWNDDESGQVDVPEESWIRVKGLIGQRELISRMQSYGFMLHLTEYPDLQSLVIQQAKKAGVINIVNNVGGNAELIENGYDGFLVDEHYMNDTCKEKVVKLITHLVDDKPYADYIRNNATGHSITWNKIAGDWMEHWDAVLGKKKRKRVVISGYYGIKNLGDEAILDRVIGYIRDIDSSAEISVVSADPYNTGRIHKVDSISPDDVSMLGREIERCDLLVLRGGGLFQDYNEIRISNFFEDYRLGTTPTGYARLPLMASMYGKPVVYCAQGVGPLFSRESLLFSRWAFGLAGAISVRDEYSYFVLTELLGIDVSKVSLSCDSVMTAELPDRQRGKVLRIFNDIPDNRKLVLVSARSWINKELEDKVVVSLSQALASFVSDCPCYHVVFIPFNMEDPEDNDITIAERISKTLPADRFTLIRRYDNYREILALFLCAEFSVGMRFHSIIFSLLANIPTIPLSYDVKTDELVREFRLEEYKIAINDVSITGLYGKMARMTGPGGCSSVESLKKILIENEDVRGIIVYKSVVDWNYPLFQRPHHLATVFARKGFLVFYCSPCYKFDNYEAGFTKLADRLYVCTGLEGLLNTLPEFIVIVNWNVDGALQPFDRAKIVYDHIDHIELAAVHNEKVRDDHLKLVREADMVSVTADDLFTEISEIRSDVVMCPNAADPDHFRIAEPSAPEDIADVLSTGRPVVGYSGALAEWFDYDLLRYAAEKRSEYSFLLVGYDYDGSVARSAIDRYGNIVRIGPVGYNVLQQYIYYFDVAIIPFTINSITRATSPVKLFEYASAGKPVVTTDLYECRKYEVVFASRSYDDFILNIDKALEVKHDKRYLEKLTSLANGNTWEERVERFISEFRKRGLIGRSPGIQSRRYWGEGNYPDLTQEVANVRKRSSEDLRIIRSFLP